MARNGRWVEAGVLAVALGLAGCVTPEPSPNPTSERGSGTPIPDNVDYVMAVQCGGLLWALQAASYRTLRDAPLTSMTGLYREWAELRAREAGKDPALALSDMAALRDDILAEADNFSLVNMKTSIERAHQGDLGACESLAKAADFDIVIIGG